MANRFIGGVLTSQKQPTTGFVSRASTGTYFSSAGVLQTAAANQPRLNYSYANGAWTSPSILIEPASTNLFTYSTNFNNSPWAPAAAGNGVTLIANSTTAPDGTNTATHLGVTTTTSGEQTLRATFSYTIGTTYTVSVYAKAAEYNWLRFRQLATNGGSSGGTTGHAWFNLSSGTIGSITSNNFNRISITSVGNGWYRCSATFTTLGAIDNTYFDIGIANGDTVFQFSGTVGSGIYLWGAQIEQNQQSATSYIPTNGSTVTRAQDDVGPLGAGMYRLSELQQQSSIDDQYTTQAFTSLGSSSWTCPADVTSVEVAVVAGGGSGADNGAGGGGGGVIYTPGYSVTPGQTYSIVVGAGGSSVTAGTNTIGTNGGNSQFGTLIALGGGYGGSGGGQSQGNQGGCGGGSAALLAATTLPGGSGTPGQGFRGGSSYGGVSPYPAGGGGGAGSQGGPAGGNATSSYNIGGAGGIGLYLPQFSSYGASGYFGGGGGGGNAVVTPYGAGGNGGGGSATAGAVGTKAGTANTGGGGGGGVGLTGGGAGGSGVVLIRYKRTNTQLSSPNNPAVVSQRFISSNTWTCPPGVTQVEALVVAGGGGGGSTTGGGGSGGGSGGLTYNSVLSVTPGQTYNIAIGYGGPGGSSSAGTNGTGSGIANTTELITNGSFASGTTGWTATTATLSSPSTGIFQIIPNASVNGFATQSITTVAGTSYVVTFTVLMNSSNYARVYAGTTSTGYDLAQYFTSYWNSTQTTGTYGFTFTATGTTTYISMVVGGGNQQTTQFSYISVKPALVSTVGGGGGGVFGGAGSNGGSGGGGQTGVGSGTSGQGNSGGIGYNWPHTNANGSGGGAGSVGFPSGTVDAMAGGNGGAGLPFNITGTLEWYAGGGGGGTYAAYNNSYGSVPGTGGVGGGGQGGFGGTPGTPGSPNTGGGGGGGGGNGNTTGSAGGSGVVILRYRAPTYAVFQDSGYWTCPSGVTSVQALVVAGGGGGGCLGGGGGAGGLLYSNSVQVTPGQTYPIIVGQGGYGAPYSSLTTVGYNGANSSFNALVAYGGGGGGSNSSNSSYATGQGGGSGGGMGSTGTSSATYNIGGAGAYGQGTNGGASVVTSPFPSGGGGGAGGGGGYGSGTVSGGGGPGLAYSISGTSITYAGGGSGGFRTSVSGTGTVPSAGGGGAGSGNDLPGYPGTINTGAGGGGGGFSANGGAGGQGGSGIVIIRWYGG